MNLVLGKADFYWRKMRIGIGKLFYFNEQLNLVNVYLLFKVMVNGS